MSALIFRPFLKIIYKIILYDILIFGVNLVWLFYFKITFKPAKVLFWNLFSSTKEDQISLFNCFPFEIFLKLIYTRLFLYSFSSLDQLSVQHFKDPSERRSSIGERNESWGDSFGTHECCHHPCLRAFVIWRGDSDFQKSFLWSWD